MQRSCGVFGAVRGVSYKSTRHELSVLSQGVIVVVVVVVVVVAVVLLPTRTPCIGLNASYSSLYLTPFLFFLCASIRPRQERKKMKRGGGEEAAAALGRGSGASGSNGTGVSGSGGGGRGFSGGDMGMGMTPGRVVVDKDDHLVRITTDC